MGVREQWWLLNTNNFLSIIISCVFGFRCAIWLVWTVYSTQLLSNNHWVILYFSPPFLSLFPLKRKKKQNNNNPMNYSIDCRYSVNGWEKTTEPHRTPASSRGVGKKNVFIWNRTLKINCSQKNGLFSGHFLTPLHIRYKCTHFLFQKKTKGNL